MRALSWILENQTRKSAVESVIAGFLGQMAVMVTGVVSARMLGPEGRGHLALIAITPTILALLAGLGIPQAFAFELAREEGRSEAMMALAMRIMAAQAAVIVIAHAAVYLLFYGGASAEVKRAMLLSVLCGPAMLAIQYSLAIWQGLCLFRKVNLARLLAPFGYALALVAFFASGGGGLAGVALCWVAPMALSAALLLWLSFSALAVRLAASGQGQSPTFASLAAFGAKGLIGTSTPLESFRLDQLAAGLLISVHSLGLYVAGQAVSNLNRFIATSLAQVAYPLVAKRRDTKAGVATMWKFFLATCCLSAAATVTLCALAPAIISLFFGPGFEDSVVIAQLLVIGSAFAAVRKSVVESVRGLGHPQISTYAELSVYPWLLTGGVALAWGYDITGLAVAMMIAYAVSLGAALTLSRKALASGGSITLNEPREWDEKQETA